MGRERDDDVTSFRTAWWQRIALEPSTYELTRCALLRLLAFVYLAAFGSLALQVRPLLGAEGLLPAAMLLAAKHAELGASAYWRVPTLFWIAASDSVLSFAALAGVVLSLAALAGATNAILQLALWALYASFVHVGQIFYGYGWELQLLETGLLAVFLCPLRSVRPLPATPAPKVIIWLFRWLVFRVMVGSALIKLRGDPCWRDLSCLDYHFETQPNPSPLAWFFHHAPHAVHVAGVLLTHFVELGVPWFAFGARRVRHAAGALLVGFQGTLILSGNLSFLNWLTIVAALACFDDTAFVRLLPKARREQLLARFVGLVRSRAQTRVARAFAIAVALLSVAPVINLASCHQEMNGAFDPLDAVNTYGAFGSVDRERYELLLEGSSGPAADEASWRAYELPCMPGDPRRRPCVVTPFQHRLDWQMWFVGNGVARGESIDQEPWLIHLVWQLLQGEPGPKRLLARDPFPNAPPRWIRAVLWRYRFSPSLSGGVWWTRERIANVTPPLSRDHSGLRAYVRAFDWPDRPGAD
jgi:hypothetical protein